MKRWPRPRVGGCWRGPRRRRWAAIWVELKDRALHTARPARCGVFRNRPQVVAELWSEVLDTLEWRGRFARVVFVVPHGLHGRSLAAFRPTRFGRWPPPRAWIPFTDLRHNILLGIPTIRVVHYVYVAVCSRSGPLTDRV